MQKWSKRQLILFTTVWFIAFVCLLLALTDLFTKSLFHRNNFAAIMMFLLTTVMIASRWIDYFKRRA
jgi:EamA domain-containing membrane protein RarD